MSSQKNTILTKLSYFEWPIEGPFAGYIQAQALPHIGAWSHYSPANISKNPTPDVSSHTTATSKWNFPIVQNEKGK